MQPIKNTFFRYLPVSESDKQWGLYVPTAGYIWSRPHMDYPLAEHPAGYHYKWEQGRILHEFQVLYVTRGQGVYESAAAGKQPIKAGDAFIILPNVWHRYGPDPDIGWDECWIGFDGDIARNLLRNQFFIPEKPVFSPGLDDSWQGVFDQAIELLEMEPLGYAQILAGLTFQILARLHVSDRTKKMGGHLKENVVRKAKLLIMEKLATKIDWEVLSRDLNVSYSVLRRIFLQHTGFSLHQYQIQLRMNKAKSLLSNPDCSIKEIAYQLGFDCPYHFSHLFKRKTQFAPEVWRGMLFNHHPRQAH
jgi:AraC-like DNA-binding protein